MNRKWLSWMCGAGLLLGLPALSTRAHAQWQVYEGFDYRSAAVEGADGGAGAWVREWRKSAQGGCVLESEGLSYRDAQGKTLKARGGMLTLDQDVSGGTFRDIDPPGKPGGGQEIWCSFLMSMQGGPFTASGDEVAVQLRNKKDVPLVTLGVMGRLNQWRIRVENNAKKRAYSPGASAVRPEEPHWIVCRIKVDAAPGAPDSVHLWIDPPLQAQPAPGQAVAVLEGEDWWGEGDGFDLHRVRVGTLQADGARGKKMKFDEFRLGLSYPAVAPVEEP